MSSFTRLLVYCMVAITLIFLSFQPKIASAQSSPVWVPTEEDYNSLNSLGWDYVLNAGCGQPLATLDISSLSAYQNSTAQLRADLYTRLGALPTKPAGELLEQKVLVTSSSYQISWVRISSRLEWVPVYGYWADPINSSGTTCGDCITWQRVLPHITLGWRLSGDEPYVNQTSTALSGVTLDLLNAGYSVFIPWLEDDRNDGGCLG